MCARAWTHNHLAARWWPSWDAREEGRITRLFGHLCTGDLGQVTGETVGEREREKLADVEK